MALIPSTKAGKVAFFQSKVEPWTDNAVAIGTTTTIVGAMSAKVTAALDALAAQFAAEQAAKTATETADNAVASLVVSGSDIIKSIRTKAATSGSIVYELAQIPAPATPTPVTTLGTPTNFKAELKQNGSLELTWKCVSPRASGMVYQIWRKIDSDPTPVYLGGSGAKKFNDATVPSGAAQVIYQIQAVRSTAVGDFATFIVTIGSGTGEQEVATVTQAKLAA